MKNPLNSIAIAFMLCTALASCRKKDSINLSNQQLVKIEQDANNYTALTYNADRTLSSIKDVEDSYINETEITYNAEKKPIIGKSNGFNLNFIYTGGKLTRINTVAQNTQGVIAFMEFTYTNNLLTQTAISADVNDQVLIGTKLFYLYHPNGDVKQITMAGLNPMDNTFEVFAIHRFEYDQMVNPLKVSAEVFSGLNWNASAHNITKETVLTADEQVTEVITTTYTYHNATGMPLTAKEVTAPVGGDAVTITKKFIYN